MIICETFLERIENLLVFVIKVYPGSSKPYFYKRKGVKEGTYVRVGATNKLADEVVIQDLTRQRLNISFDEEICYGVELTSIDLQKLMNDIHTFTNKTIDEQQLLNLKLLKKEANTLLPTND